MTFGKTRLVDLDASFVHVSAGPLTKNLTAESFSDRQVSFTLTTWLAVGFVYVVFLVHELYANRVQPVLVSHRGNSLRFQSALLFRWFSNFLNDAMLLPITLDFATSMGQTASMSGFFISCSLFASVLGVVMGQWIVNESAWDQQRARALILWSPVLYTVVLLLEAALSNGAAQLSVSSKQAGSTQTLHGIGIS